NSLPQSLHTKVLSSNIMGISSYTNLPAEEFQPTPMVGTKRTDCQATGGTLLLTRRWVRPSPGGYGAEARSLRRARARAFSTALGLQPRPWAARAADCPSRLASSAARSSGESR